MTNKTVEILAPCGSLESFNAAVNAGADACYLAGTRFGARAYAKNFDTSELCRVIDKAHLKGVKVYMTVNTLFKNAEICALIEYLNPFYECGLDAVIVQDMGVFKLVRETFPDLPVHASTQMNICSSEAAAWLKELGATRVIPARELTLKEIADIKRKVDIEIETFVHGAMCYSYSGRCLLSSMIGDRSGNRGRCAQPCRKKYNGSYSMSMKDMCTLMDVPMLIDAGVDSLKIEGRMKGEYYTAAVVSAYKEIANDHISGSFSEKKCERLIRNLADIFNRGGFSGGYLYGNQNEEMIDSEAPGHKGVEIGNVSSAGRGKVLIRLSDAVNKKDVLTLKLKDGIVIELTSDKAARRGETLVLNAPKSNMISIDAPVYRKINDALLNSIRENVLENEKLVPVRLECDIMVGRPITMRLISDRASAEAEGSIAEVAKSSAVSTEAIRSKIAAFGNTGYYPSEIVINNDEKSFVSFSELKNLRRKLIEELEKNILDGCRRHVGTDAADGMSADDVTDAADDVSVDAVTDAADDMSVEAVNDETGGMNAETVNVETVNDETDAVDSVNSGASSSVDASECEDKKLHKEIFFGVENMKTAGNLLKAFEALKAGGNASDEGMISYNVCLDADRFTVNELCELREGFSSFSDVTLAFPYIHREKDEEYFKAITEEKFLKNFDSLYIRCIDDLAMLLGRKLLKDKTVILASSLYAYNDKAADFFREKLIYDNAAVSTADTEAVSCEKDTEAVPGEEDTEAVLCEKDTEAVPGEKDTEAVSCEKDTEAVPGEKDTEAVSCEKDTEAVSGENDREANSDKKGSVEIPSCRRLYFEQSHELTSTELAGVSYGRNAEKLLLCYGHETLMITDQPVEKSKAFLKDERSGRYFYIICDKLRYNRLMDNRLLLLKDSLEGFIYSDENTVIKLDLLDESSDDISALIGYILSGGEKKPAYIEKCSITEGHFDNRNIL
ncbi:MAG TPA: hypothetical protein DCY81_05675 [Lachnospiraceae bacterium]|nr:hypothetical protein [Lachnospiraceae bacterium]